jgi:hypothetical protein
MRAQPPGDERELLLPRFAGTDRSTLLVASRLRHVPTVLSNETPTPMRRHSPRPLAAIALTLMFMTAGCSPSTQEKDPVDFKQNPNPVQAYRITMRLDNPPGPFGSMVALAQYDVTETECLPPPRENHGHKWPVPTEDVPIELARVSDTEYTGIVYVDRMLDEDYYGRGVCHWQLIQARVHLKATGDAKGETLFIPSFPFAKIDVSGSQRTFFWKGHYPGDPESTLEEFPYIGHADRSAMAADITDEDVFSVTLTASREAP